MFSCLLQLQPEWQRFVTLVKKSQELKIVSYHKLYDILKQHQNEVNEIRAERLTRTANPLALKIYKPTNNNLKTSSNTSRAHQDNTLRINIGTGYDNQMAVNVTGARENVARECRKQKRAKDAAYYKEKMILYKQEEAGFQSNAEQADWKDDTDDEPADYELEAHYVYMAKIQEDDDDDLAKERDLLASLIEKLKCEFDDSKGCNKFLESSNKTLVDKLKGVISTTSVSRPQLKSNRLEDRVMHNNSEGKKQQVEDHRRNFKFSNNKTSVTACNDSLNAKTSNVNFVCVTCGKCVLNDNHDMCVLHYINGVNSRTKMPMVVPISTREPKRTVNQSAATPLKRTVAAESTNQKPRSTIRKQYEQISKTCRWWYCKITPPGYKWKPKSRTVNVEPNVSMHLGTKSRTTNISEPTTLRKSTVSNTPSSSNSFAARRDNFIHRRLWVLKAHDGKSQASK
ncbi:hypothetical protein Tco_0686595 [Tanacetum coccineum]